MKRKILLFSLLPLAATFAQASVLQINFGSTAVDAPSNSPYHTVDGAFTDTTWNQVNGTTDINGSVPNPGALTYSDGTSASGISMTLGASINSLVADFNTSPTNSRTLANTQASSIYQLSTMESLIWSGSNEAGQINLVASRIDGLAAGQYEVYVWGYFGNTNPGNWDLGKAAKQFYAEAGTTASTFDITSLDPIDADGDFIINDIGEDEISSWQAGANYAVKTITLNAGESLYVVGSDADLGGDDDQWRGALSGMQIVSLGAVPEPSTYALVFGILGLGIVSFRRFKKRA